MFVAGRWHICGGLTTYKEILAYPWWVPNKHGQHLIRCETNTLKEIFRICLLNTTTKVKHYSTRGYVKHAPLFMFPDIFLYFFCDLSWSEFGVDPSSFICLYISALLLFLQSHYNQTSLEGL